MVLRRPAVPPLVVDTAGDPWALGPSGAVERTDEVMGAFGGIDHLSLSVTDLEASQRFYTGVLDFDLLMDFGEVRILIDRPSSFVLSLIRHTDGHPGPFSELHPGVDHVGLTAGSVDELVEWEARFRAAGVVHTPIRDMPFGRHLNFRDPDGIPFEFFVPNDVLVENLRELREREVPQEEIRARVEQVLGADLGRQ